MAGQGSRKTTAKVQRPAPDVPRYNAPRGIAALLAPVLRPALTRRSTALAALLADWSEIVGHEIGSRTAPVKFAAGTLTIGCAGPDALTLQHVATSMISRINLALGGAPVQRLRFTDMNIVPAAPGRPSARGATIPAAPPGGLPEGPLGEALARLHAGLSRQQRTQ